MQQALEHREAALKLAEHWKEEAIKQARFAQVSTCASAAMPYPYHAQSPAGCGQCSTSAWHLQQVPAPDA